MPAAPSPSKGTCQRSCRSVNREGSLGTLPSRRDPRHCGQDPRSEWRAWPCDGAPLGRHPAELVTNRPPIAAMAAKSSARRPTGSDLGGSQVRSVHWRIAIPRHVVSLRASRRGAIATTGEGAGVRLAVEHTKAIDSYNCDKLVVARDSSLSSPNSWSSAKNGLTVSTASVAGQRASVSGNDDGADESAAVPHEKNAFPGLANAGLRQCRSLTWSWLFLPPAPEN